MTPEEAEKLVTPLNLQLDCTSDGKVKATATYILNENENTTEKTFDRLPGVLVTPVGTLTLNAKDSTKIQEERTIQVQIVSPTSAAKLCQENLSTEPTSKQTTIVKLNYNDSHVGRGLDFLTTLVALYNADANDDKNEVASRTAEFIDERISIINHELGTTENELASYKQKAGLTDLTSDAKLALQGNAEYEQKRAENATQLRLVEFLKEYIERPENRMEIIPANIGLSDNGLSTLIGQYNEMLTERKRLLRISSESNPAVVNLDTSLEANRKNILTSVASVLKGLEITRNDLNREAAQFASRISNAPSRKRTAQHLPPAGNQGQSVPDAASEAGGKCDYLSCHGKQWPYGGRTSGWRNCRAKRKIILSYRFNFGIRVASCCYLPSQPAPL